MQMVLIIGSSPDALRVREWDLSRFSSVVVVNNAWQIDPRWSHLVHPDDFPPDKRPHELNGKIVVTSSNYVPANNSYGGIIYAGGTMAFTTAYWALDALKPDVMAFVGCDMIYDDRTATHFYGAGDADPLRDDPTLQSLEAKSERLRWMAFEDGCLCLNLSSLPESELTFDRVCIDEVSKMSRDLLNQALLDERRLSDSSAAKRALEAEHVAAQFCATGDYWNAETPPDVASLAGIDRLWLNVFKHTLAG